MLKSLSLSLQIFTFYNRMLPNVRTQNCISGIDTHHFRVLYHMELSGMKNRYWYWNYRSTLCLSITDIPLEEKNKTKQNCTISNPSTKYMYCVVYIQTHQRYPKYMLRGLHRVRLNLLSIIHITLKYEIYPSFNFNSSMICIKQEVLRRTFSFKFFNLYGEIARTIKFSDPLLSLVSTSKDSAC
jgi:hypothetical protein